LLPIYALYLFTVICVGNPMSV
jgi:hypothetical protein